LKRLHLITWACLLAALEFPVLLQSAEPASAERWEPEIREFEARDREHSPPAGAIVFTGSSSVRGWESLEQDFKPFVVLNRGFGGSQIADVTRYVDRIVIPYRPSLVVLYAGDNDIANGRSPEQVAADFRGFVGKVRAGLPDVPILYISIKPSPSRWALWPKMKQANALIRLWCGHNPGLGYVDVATPMLGPDGTPRAELFQEDGLHLNSRGYALWTRIVGPCLARSEPAGRK
jgi:lysophospholipase L1-like esterase